MIKPYLKLMRLHHPVPILIMIYPILWSFFSIDDKLLNIKLFLIFLLGAFIVRTAGCIFNDIIDRDFDLHVKRTFNRPLATSSIKIKSAFSIFFILISLAFFLVLQLQLLTILLSFFALLSLLLYPFFKRFFFIPQIFLGISFNFGIIMIYSEIYIFIPLEGYILYIATIFWTISYDTIYALPDKKYDLKLNLHSSAIFFKNHIMHALIIIQTVTIIFLIIFAYIHCYNILFYLFLFLVINFFIYQNKLCKKEKINHCLKAFFNNHWIGFVILLSILFQNN